jgi:acetyltransferase-like isoleucine patch superfamily enzyme
MPHRAKIGAGHRFAARAYSSRTVSPVTQDLGPDLPKFAQFGTGSTIHLPFRVAGAEHIFIGDGVNFSPGSWLSVVDEHNGRRHEPKLVVNDGARFGPDLVIACVGSIEIGPRALIASRVFIGDTYHDYRDPEVPIRDQPMAEPQPVKIGGGAFLGIGCAVLPGVSIGERAYVGAGAVVTADVPPNSVAVGNPARVVRHWDARQGRWVASGRRSRRRSRTKRSAQLDQLRQELALSEQRASLAEAERLAAQDAVNALEVRLAQSVALLAEAQGSRQELEFWLEDHRESLSWRLTEPLRAAKRVGLAARSRRKR